MKMKMKMKVEVGASIEFSRKELRRVGLKVGDLRRAFSYPNPDRMKKKRLGMWEGSTPSKITLADFGEERVSLPRGVFDRFKKLAAAEGVELEVVAKTAFMTGPAGPIDFGFSPPFDLDPDQRAAVRAMVRRRSGIGVGPCASGKTIIGLAALAAVGERAIVLVHTGRILEAWLEEVRNVLRGRFVLGRVDGRRKELEADLVVATIQTIRNVLKKDPAYARRFGTVVLDEAHHCPAKTFAETVQAFPARHRWALTATPRRRDGKECLLFDAFGSRTRVNRNGREVSDAAPIFVIDDADLDRYGRIVPVDVVVVPTDFEYDFQHAKAIERDPKFEAPEGLSPLRLADVYARFIGDPSPNKHANMLDAMARDKRRQARILEYLLPEMKARRPSILLADRREFCLEVEGWLGRRGIRCGRLLGGARDRKAQDTTAAAIAEGKLFVAVGTTVADEGMNIKPLSRGFGCTPVSSRGRLTQQFGRLKRKSPGKDDAVYFYFWDRRVRPLRGHLREVMNLVKAPHRVWYSASPGSREALTPALCREIEGSL